MFIRLAQLTLGAARADDEGLVNIIITLILVAMWAMGAYARRRSTKPSPGQGTSRTEFPSEEMPDLPEEADDLLEEQTRVPQYAQPEPPEPVPTYPEPVAEPMPDGYAIADLATPVSLELQPSLDLTAHAGAPDPESPSLPWVQSGAGLWTSTGGGSGDEPEIVSQIDPDRLRRAVVLSEILAEPVSTRPPAN